MATKRNATKKQAGSKKLIRAKKIQSVKPLTIYAKYDGTSNT